MNGCAYTAGGARATNGYSILGGDLMYVNIHSNLFLWWSPHTYSRYTEPRPAMDSFSTRSFSGAI
jgi:hypothetical protein